MRGIVGFERSCFMNAVINALAYIPCFSQTLLTHDAFQNIDNDRQPLLAALKGYFQILLEPATENPNTKIKRTINSNILNKSDALWTHYLYNNKVKLMGTCVIDKQILTANYDIVDFFDILIETLCLESSNFVSLKESIFGYNRTRVQYCKNGHTTFGGSFDDKLVINIGIECTDKKFATVLKT